MSDPFNVHPRMNRLRALDGLRGCAILWILAYHLVALPMRAAALPALPGVTAIADYGWVGVSLFFVLSGYLITLGLVDKPQDRRSFGVFWVRRVFRIAPAYALLLASFVLARSSWAAGDPAAGRIFNSAIPPWSYAVFAQNFYMAKLGYLGNDWLRVLWSLAVEVQFYLLISIILFLMPRHRTVPFLAFLAACSLAFRYALYFTQEHPDAAMVVLLPSRLDGFLMGGLLALTNLRGDGARVGPSLGALAAALAFLACYPAGTFGAMQLYAIPLYPTVVSVACAAFLQLCTARTGPLARLMESRPLREAGRLSYFVYLFHMPIAIVVFHCALNSEPSVATPGAIAVMALVLASIYAAARLSYMFIESPLIRYSHGVLQVPAHAPQPAIIPAADP